MKKSNFITVICNWVKLLHTILVLSSNMESKIGIINFIFTIKYLRAGLTSKGQDKDALSSAFTT